MPPWPSWAGEEGEGEGEGEEALCVQLVSTVVADIPADQEMYRGSVNTNEYKCR